MADGNRVRSRRWWRLAGVSGVAGLAGLLVFLGLVPDRWLDKFDKLGNVGGLVVALAALAVSIWSAVRALRVPAVDPAMVLCRAMDDMAETVARQWRAEVNARGLGHLDPIRVRWSATSRPVAPSPVELLDDHQLPAPPVKVTRVRLSGDIEDMTRALARLPARQLVVIGSPGAGKSTLAVLLTLGLLERRQAGASVPVLVTVSSWDPDREHLDTWLVRRLGELYPALGGRGRYGIDTAVRLVDRGLVMPILDGLDEMPDPVQARAINALTVAVGRDRPLVLTSRAEEYQAAVAQAGSPLARAAVMEIEPITAADAAAYLPTGQVDGVARWRPVLDHLTAHPDGVLAQALRTPLMVYLARTAYLTPGSDPAALLAFTDPDTIELHLLDAYLPAVYAPRRPPSNPEHATATDRTTCSVQQARRWLAFLADHLTREDTTDLSWWRLHRAVPRFPLVFGLVFGPVFGLVGGLTGGLAFGPALGLAGGLAAGLAFGLTVGLVFGLMFGLTYGLRAGLRAGLGVGLPVGLGGGLAAGLPAGLTVGLAVGLVFGLVVRQTGSRQQMQTKPRRLGVARTLWKTGSPQQMQVNPKRLGVGLAFGLVFGLTTGLVFGLTTGLVFGLTTGLAVGLTTGLAVGLVFALVYGLGAPASLTETVTPPSTLKNDKKISLLVGFAVAAAVAVTSAAVAGFVGRLVAGLGSGLWAGLWFGLLCTLDVGSWLSFVVARVLLAARSQLPANLMPFLHDAYRRGVLRQVGAVYQFRHARLQQHLTTLHRTIPSALDPPTGEPAAAQPATSTRP